MQNRWVLIVLGIWLVVSPFVLSISGTGRWSNIVVGVIVAGLGALSKPGATS